MRSCSFLSCLGFALVAGGSALAQSTLENPVGQELPYPADSGGFGNATGEPLVEPIHHDLTVSDARFSPDSRFLVVSSQAAKLLLWWEISAAGVASRKAELEHPIRAFRF